MPEIPAYEQAPQEISPETRLGRQLGLGQVTVTGTSTLTGAHVTIRIKCRNKNDKTNRWQRCNWDDRICAFVEEEHSGRRVATIRKDGQVWPTGSSPRQPALMYTLLNALRVAGGGVANTQITLQTSDQCGHCRLPLTDPESITRGIGPICYGKLTGSKYLQVAADDALPALVEVG
jgi:hypothetical protein